MTEVYPGGCYLLVEEVRITTVIMEAFQGRGYLRPWRLKTKRKDNRSRSGKL